MKPIEFHTFACRQLAQSIHKGKHVEECKAVWLKRWALEYPFYKSSNGIKEHP